MSLTVGLTGGIGSGKSAAADLFAALGAGVVDTGAIAHELTCANGAALPAIFAAFGDGLRRSEDGALDRGAMRRLVFGDTAAKARLEAILHPLIRQESLARVHALMARGDVPYVLLVVPLLVESGAYAQVVDRVLLVDCDEALQRARVMARNGLAADEVQAIIDSQATRSARRAQADDNISNDSDYAALRAQIAALHRRYLALAAQRSDAGEVNANC